MQVNGITQRRKYWTNKLAMSSMEGWYCVCVLGIFQKYELEYTFVDTLNMLPLLSQ